MFPRLVSGMLKSLLSRRSRRGLAGVAPEVLLQCGNIVAHASTDLDVGRSLAHGAPVAQRVERDIPSQADLSLGDKFRQIYAGDGSCGSVH